MQWHYLDGETQAGPVNGERVAELYASGSVSDDTLVWKEGMANWLPFSQTELWSTLRKPAATDAVPAAPPAPPITDPNFVQNVIRFRSGANWFYWIAGLSVINSVIALFSGGVFFLVGLGVSQLISGVGSAFGGEKAALAAGIAFVLNLVVIGLVAAAGYFSHKGIFWVYLVAAILYAFDGLIFLFVGDWFPFAFHIYVEFCLVRGLIALKAVKKVVPAF